MVDWDEVTAKYADLFRLESDLTGFTFDPMFSPVPPAGQAHAQNPASELVQPSAGATAQGALPKLVAQRQFANIQAAPPRLTACRSAAERTQLLRSGLLTGCDRSYHSLTYDVPLSA